VDPLKFKIQATDSFSQVFRKLQQSGGLAVRAVTKDLTAAGAAQKRLTAPVVGGKSVWSQMGEAGRALGAGTGGGGIAGAFAGLVVRNPMASVALLAGAAYKMESAWAEAGRTVTQVAQATGQSRADIQATTGAANFSGVDAGAATSGIQSLAQKGYEYKINKSSEGQLWKQINDRLGIDVDKHFDDSGNLNVRSYSNALAKRLDDVRVGPLRDAVINAVGGGALAPMLRQGSAKVNRDYADLPPGIVQADAALDRASQDQRNKDIAAGRVRGRTNSASDNLADTIGEVRDAVSGAVGLSPGVRPGGNPTRDLRRDLNDPSTTFGGSITREKLEVLLRVEGLPPGTRVMATQSGRVVPVRIGQAMPQQ
jgi:hypothetical protein